MDIRRLNSANDPIRYREVDGFLVTLEVVDTDANRISPGFV